MIYRVVQAECPVLVVFSAENVTKQAILVVAIDVDVLHIVSSLIIT